MAPGHPRVPAVQVRGAPALPWHHGPRWFLGTLVSCLGGWASTENCLKHFSRLDGRYGVGEGDQVGLPENTAEKAPRHTNACGSGGRTSRLLCGRKAGIHDGLTSHQMRPLLVTRSAGRVHAPHRGLCPDPGPGTPFPEPSLPLPRTVCMSQSLPSASPSTRTPFSRWVQSRLPRGPRSPEESRAKCGPPGRGEFLLPHSPASRCWRVFYYWPLWLVRNGILMSF